MSRILYLNDEMKKNIIKSYNDKIHEAMLYDDDLDWKPEFKKYQATVSLVFSPIAFLKMWTLVQYNQQEIAWHGVVEKTASHKYYVSDILVYPQHVTAVTAENDELEYVRWSMKLPDEVANKLLLQGHSHVNMSVNPSSKDIDTQRDTLKKLRSGFYIFMIMNKRNDMFFKIVDLEDNMVYDSKDVYIMIEGNEFSSFDWQDETQKMLTKSFIPSFDAVKNDEEMEELFYESL